MAVRRKTTRYQGPPTEAEVEGLEKFEWPPYELRGATHGSRVMLILVAYLRPRVGENPPMIFWYTKVGVYRPLFNDWIYSGARVDLNRLPAVWFRIMQQALNDPRLQSWYAEQEIMAPWVE
jgi:hypothetical protein